MMVKNGLNKKKNAENYPGSGSHHLEVRLHIAKALHIVIWTQVKGEAADAQ